MLLVTVSEITTPGGQPRALLSVRDRAVVRAVVEAITARLGVELLQDSLAEEGEPLPATTPSTQQ